MRTAAALLLAVTLLAPCASATTNNDDSCDIGVYPAATLLLPYFEVETAQRATDTFFTVTNVSNVPQIAHVTIWTSWAFPVLTFNLFLTGYDVQSISMYDVIVNGNIAPGASAGTSSTIAPGALSVGNNANPNLSLAGCDQLPGVVPEPLRTAVRSALTTGVYNAPRFGSSCGTNLVGSGAWAHMTPTTAVGYVTIDVTSRCSSTYATDPAYFLSEILFDNVLTGDYQILDKTPGRNFAGGSPLVHIRAIPEGGPAGTFLTPVQTNLSTTFYARYVNGSTIFNGPWANVDRRQPLPATFAARWYYADYHDTTAYRIWREGVTGPLKNTRGGVYSTSCGFAAENSQMPFQEAVRFDEHENASVILHDCSPFCFYYNFTSATSTLAATLQQFPPVLSTPGDAAGWMYLNLDNGLTPKIASQNWVVVSMSTGGLSADFDATPLGNGCSPPAAISIANGGKVAIGPAP
jgi:hypothetical protein